MNSKKMFFVMIGVVTLLVGLGVASIVLGNLVLQKKSNKLVNLKLDAQVLDAQQLALVQANKDVEKYTPLEAIARAVVPQDKDQAQTVREIISIAKSTGIDIASISFPSSTLGTSSSASPAPSGSPPAAGSTPSSSLTQVTPVSGITGVYQLPITIQSNTSNPAPYSQLIAFLQALEQNRRTAQVGQITITPDPKNPTNLSFSLQINVFIKP